MIATTVAVHIKPEHVDDFIAATRRNHEGSVKEPGNIRFDVLQSRSDPSRFTLYEVFADEKAVAAHKETPHYREWKTAVEPWQEKPREGLPHNVLAPTDPAAW